MDTRASVSMRCVSATRHISAASVRDWWTVAMSDALPGFAASLDRLAQRFGLGARQVEQLQHFGGVLVNDEHAPTTVRDPGRVRDDHFADTFVALDLPVVRGASTIADLGAGAGVPGIPLAI